MEDVLIMARDLDNAAWSLVDEIDEMDEALEDAELRNLANTAAVAASNLLDYLLHGKRA